MRPLISKSLSPGFDFFREKVFSRPEAALLVAIAVLFVLAVFAPKGAQAQETCPYTLPDSPTDRDHLIAFYCATGGDNWTNNTGWLSSEGLAAWHGLEGIPGLTFTPDGRPYTLRLNDNNLTGEIPTELVEMTSLIWVWLHFNKLTGEIPAALGSMDLSQLALHGNKLTGSIPTELGNLTSLAWLSLSDNRLTGEIPASLGNLSNLKWLYLHNNPGLTGELPLSLKDFWRLDTVDIRCTGITTPANADFQRWLAEIEFYQGCATSTSTPSPPSTGDDGPDSDFLTYNSPNNFDARVQGNVVNVSWTSPAHLDRVDSLEYKVQEGWYTSSAFDLGDVVIPWTRIDKNATGIEIDIHKLAPDTKHIFFIRSVSGERVTSANRTNLPTVHYSSVSTENSEIPEEISLGQNYPNPFNPGTSISWTQPVSGQVRLSVYNLLGQTMATLVDGVRPAGEHEVRLDASGWPGGVYVYVLETGTHTLTRHMVLLK